VSLFYEDSTRTRLSFETAAKRLSADTMTFSVGTSSAKKGESLRDTVETICAMGVDAIVIRHGSAGVPWQLAQWVDVSVINAGDGWHEHPTQALLDCYRSARAGPVVRRAPRGDRGRREAQPGGPLQCAGLTAISARVTLVAPPTLLPPSLAGWDVDVSGSTTSCPSSTCATCCACGSNARSRSVRRCGGAPPALTPSGPPRSRPTPWSCTPPKEPGQVAPEVEARPDRSHQTGDNGVAVRMAVLASCSGRAASAATEVGREPGDPRRRGDAACAGPDVVIDGGCVVAVGPHPTWAAPS
jgi:hypothetical protein